MKKRTHLIFAALLFILLNGIFSLPLPLALLTAIGAIFPDLDWLSAILHRRLFHNIWTLLLIVGAGWYFSLLDKSMLIAFSMGFLSHLVADSVTPHGVKPFWPIQVPHLSGPIRSGSALEFVILILLLFAIGYLTGIVQLRLPI